MNQIAADTYLAAAVVVHHARVLIVRRSYRERFLPGAWGCRAGSSIVGSPPRAVPCGS